MIHALRITFSESLKKSVKPGMYQLKSEQKIWIFWLKQWVNPW